MTFEPDAHSRVFGVPPGADFPLSIVRHLVQSFAHKPPEHLAHVLIFVNSARMRRRLKQAFVEAGPLLLPKIALVSDFVPLVPEAKIPRPLPPLERQLEMSRLIEPLLAGAHSPAPKSAIYDLSNSLIGLMDEMHTEGVPPEEVMSLDVGGVARHWQQSKAFINIVQTYVEATHQSERCPAARQRSALLALLEKWERRPPDTPVLVVGSTGSRGTTFELMQAVTHLPRGYVILPAFDDQLPLDVWASLTSEDVQHEDHPQYRFAALLKSLNVTPAEVVTWPADIPDDTRNKLVSLSLRPAPVTDQWREYGPELGDLRTATQGLALLEASDPREEAHAIAVGMREALDAGKSVALITPDRALSRRVTAALQRWSIIPDDSGGMPLSLTPPGRILRQVARMLGRPVEPGDFIALLRHPLVSSGGDDRGQHVLWVNALDLCLRKAGLPHVTSEFVTNMGESVGFSQQWCDWIAAIIEQISETKSKDLGAFCALHISITESLARGRMDSGSGGLWDLSAGELAHSVMEQLSAPGISASKMTSGNYIQLLESLLNAESARPKEAGRQDAVVLGALEARVHGADVVILGGLNEGTWPSSPVADPWLSRSMRKDAGLLSPERQTGLSAHDYEHAICAEEVILSRALRNEEAETVPSRWLNRLTNLIAGLSQQHGQGALHDMASRGIRLIEASKKLDAPSAKIAAEDRPAPAPPRKTRPTKFSVTVVEKLIRDPYWIYARYILKLNALRPINAQPDAALRGTVFHKVVEQFIEMTRNEPDLRTEEAFTMIARDVVEADVPWPSTRRLWFGHLAEIASDFVASEVKRSVAAKNLATETSGSLKLPNSDFVITGEADRIDTGSDGRLVVYDYKSGAVPTQTQAMQYNPQLLIEAIMAEQGAFPDVRPSEVASVAYLSLSRAGKSTEIPMTKTVITRGQEIEEMDFRTPQIEENLKSLLLAYLQEGRGYVSRRAMEKMRFEGDFDHLARFGEWDETHEPVRIKLP